MNLILISLIAFLVVVVSSLSLRMFFEKKKGDKEWSAWANLISATGTVIVGVATIFVMFQENSIQIRLAKMEEAEHQPVFVLRERIEEHIENGDKFLNQEFYCYNHGAIVKSIEDFTFDVFYEIKYNNKSYYAPIIDFYALHTLTGALQGEIVHSYNSVNNLSHFPQSYLSGEVNKNSIEARLLTTYKVEFIDLFGEKKAAYFKGESEISDYEYKAIAQKAGKDFHGRFFLVERDTVDDIVNSLEQQ
jgi:hypothetical protein